MREGLAAGSRSTVLVSVADGGAEAALVLTAETHRYVLAVTSAVASSARSTSAAVGSTQR